jgi:DNA polymerase
MPLSREQMLVEMGISPLWVLREPIPDNTPESPGAVAPTAIETPPQSAAPLTENLARTEAEPASTVAEFDWPALLAGIRDCRACELCKQRRQVVPGVGDLSPDWLFIGEGPGAEEDARGEPFVGQAGRLLDAMLDALGMTRGNKVYIANAVKCRPPNNRTPEAAEMAACRPWLERQIVLLKPKVIVLLGKAAAHTILGNDGALSGMRGKRFEYAGIPVAVTYHPAYLLRSQHDKAKAWEDLLFARRLLP